MEKSNMLATAERQQQERHGGSSSSAGVADAVITVTVDPDALDCPICYHPLAPPVFQCAVGHVICSACRDRLHDSSKCQVCAVTTGYGRCYAVERILRSVRVPCSNEVHGCGVQMLFHEREEHEKKCAHARPGGGGSADVLQVQHGAWLPANRLALVLPDISRVPATVTISIGDQRSEKEGEVLMLGPCGGSGGEARDMDMVGVNRVAGMYGRHCNAVDAILVLYERKGKPECDKLWGGRGGDHFGFFLEADEYLTSVHGHYGLFNGIDVVRSLKFVSNIHTYGPYGKEIGAPFTLPAGPGGKILGFHARSGQFLNAIGTYVKMD